MNKNGRHLAAPAARESARHDTHQEGGRQYDSGNQRTDRPRQFQEVQPSQKTEHGPHTKPSWYPTTRADAVAPEDKPGTGGHRNHQCRSDRLTAE